ncbi:MAG: transposase [Sandaracinaceae bacterium]|nr:transposase [Sandaracinaceae bacterium]
MRPITTARFASIPERFARADIERVAERIRARVTRLIEKRDEQNDHAADPLAACYASSLANAAAREPAAQSAPCSLAAFHAERTLPAKKPTGLRARIEGFDLRAGVVIAKHQRKQLEHLCRYLTRPRLFRTTASHSLTTAASASNSRRHGSDGTTHLTLDRSHFAHA